MNPPRIRDDGCVRPWCHLVAHHALGATPTGWAMPLVGGAIVALMIGAALIARGFSR